MRWGLSRSPRGECRPAWRRVILKVEELEDRATPSAATLLADLGAAQFNQAVLDAAARGRINTQAAIMAVPLVQSDLAAEQRILIDAAEIRTEAAAQLAANRGADHFLHNIEVRAIRSLNRDVKLLMAAGPAAFLPVSVAPATQPAAPTSTTNSTTATTTTSTQTTTPDPLASITATTPVATTLGKGTSPLAGTATGSSGATLEDPVLATLVVNPLNINLLGLQVQTDAPITVTVSAQPGSGLLLGNLLTVVGNLVNLQATNTALNNVLGNVVNLLNSASLSVTGVNTSSGPLSTGTVTTTPVLDLFVAPVHVNLLGAQVDTSPIHLLIKAQSGPGLVLGNVVTDVANLFNPPLPKKLNLDFINQRLAQLVQQLNDAIPGIPPAPTTPVTPAAGAVLRLAVAPIDVNLLGLNLKTSRIQVNADAQTGNGLLLGNVVQTVLNTLDATPDRVAALNNNLNAILAKVVGVLNASNLSLASGALGSLSPVLQTLTAPDLVTATPGATAPVLNLSIASPDGTSPPVNVNLLGLKITTSDIQVQLIAKTGQGQVLGNLLYNVAHLLDPGGVLGLLTILNQLSL